MVRIALVTGANKGIGLETVRGLVKSGEFDHVYLTARNPELGQASRDRIAKEENSEIVKFHQLDITDGESIEALKNYILEKYGGLDVLGWLTVDVLDCQKLCGIHLRGSGVPIYGVPLKIHYTPF